MRCVLSAVLGLAALGVVGCFSPEIEDNLACPTGDCPPGQMCDADQICRPEDGGDEQSFRISWQLVSGDWVNTTCEATSLENVIIRTHEVNTDAGYEDWVNCADGVGETSTIPVGSYEIWLDITDGGDNLVVSSPATPHDLPAGETVNLGTATLPVDTGYIETFPCANGVGETQHYPLATYSVTLTQHDGSGATVGPEQYADVTMYYGAAGVDLGYFEWTW